ncbi:MAG: hypothetical protein EXR72_03045 [Myxococcales bacterium]|nr:hypothetical protein [Myxococcales bacterium]
MAAPFALLLGTGAFAANDTKGADADLPFAKQANLTPQETLVQSKEYMGKMQDTLRQVNDLQTLATKQKDIIKLNCVNDKLLQLKGHLAVSDASMTNMNDAISKNDVATRMHEFTRITILHQKVSVLGTEAQNCIGDSEIYVGNARVDVEVDPSIPAADVTDPGFPVLDVTRPPQASSRI